MNDITENKKAITMILENLKEKNHIIKKETYLSGYFIFENGDDSVCHFYIKGCKGWKFGIWVVEKAEEKDEYIHFFAQYEKFIDKFKPSASTYLQSIKKNNFDEFVENKENKPFELYLIEEMVREIKCHPLLSFYKDICCESYLPSNFKIFKTYIENHTSHFIRKNKEFLNNLFAVIKNKPISFFMSKNKIIHEVEFIDRNKDGWKCFPRYNLNVVFKESSTDEQQDKFIEFWKLEKYRNNIGVEYFVETET